MGATLPMSTNYFGSVYGLGSRLIKRIFGFSTRPTIAARPLASRDTQSLMLLGGTHALKEPMGFSTKGFSGRLAIAGETAQQGALRRASPETLVLFSSNVIVGPLTQLLLQSEQLPGFAQAADSLAVPPPFRPKSALLSAEPGARASGAASDRQSVGPRLPQRQLSH